MSMMEFCALKIRRNPLSSVIRACCFGLKSKIPALGNLHKRFSLFGRYASSSLRLAALAPFAVLVGSNVAGAQSQLKLSVSDISYLWPVPTSQAEVDMLINAESVWPNPSFDAVLEMAQDVKVTGGDRKLHQIVFPQAAHFEDRINWKLVGFRVDPSAPSSDPEWIKRVGSIPQIRLIMQPVSVTANGVIAHDFAAHVAYSFVLSGPNPFVPDHAKFSEILDDLLDLKAFLLAANPSVSTEGALRVNPGLAGKVPGFSAKVAGFLHKHLANMEPDVVSFMGVSSPQPDPWIFFAWDPAVSKDAVGAIMLNPTFTVLDGSVTPIPENRNLQIDPPVGVSTAVLFKRALDLEAPAVPGRSMPLNKDIPDIIANPMMSNVLNTDCASCHSETTRRTILKLAPSKYQYVVPEGIYGVETSLLPKTNYNVRNFGWYQLGINPPQPAVTMRASNETADALEFIKKEYKR